MQGGKRAGAGRKKGIQNKLNAALREKLNAGGIAPLEFMLEVMRDAHQDLAVRLEMAKASAPYLHARMAAVEPTGKDEKDATPLRWQVVLVPTPKREALSNESLPSNRPAQLTQGHLLPSAGTIISCEVNGEVIPSSQWDTYA